MSATRNLVLVLGDQLDARSAAFDGFDPVLDRILMVEAADEGARTWSHRQRIALFLAAMRHFAAGLRERGWPLDYRTLTESGKRTLLEVVEAELRTRPAGALLCVLPGEWRIREGLHQLARRAGLPLVLREDGHFYASPSRFAAWARGRKDMRMEYFYREMRREHGVLVDAKGEPEGGRWNFDAENRKSFGKAGPGKIRPPLRFEPDALTRAVLDEVVARFPGHPGSLDSFGWPVTRAQARAALDDFIRHRLPHFGDWQDAMWTGQPWLHHSLLASAMNLKLVDPREAVDAAVAAWREGNAPLPAVEGFVRQILGWREFIRGAYWLDMPDMDGANHFGHRRALPAWYWTGRTHMHCLSQAIGQTLEYGYAHHIQRLMLTGLFGVLAEVEPSQVSAWYLGAYVDAVEWVEHPNTLGMALYANGGRFTSKPYVASGAYVKRMSNYCDGCRYDPAQKTGPRACPITTLYWRFLDRHEPAFAANPRTALMVHNLARLSADEREAIRQAGDAMLARLDDL